MEEKEAKAQQALGTRERQVYVTADWRDTVDLIEEFEKAFNNFGLFLYSDPEMEGSDQYGFIASDQQLTEAQLKKLSVTMWK